MSIIDRRRRRQNSERWRFGRLQVEAHADGGRPVVRRGGVPPGGRVQDPAGPHGPRLEAALPGEKEAVVVVRRRGRDRGLGVVRIVYEEKQVVKIAIKRADAPSLMGAIVVNSRDKKQGKRSEKLKVRVKKGRCCS